MPMNMASNCHLITLFKIKTSGIDKVTVAVIKANAVPNGTPFSTNASIIGITLTEFAYKGTPSNVARGTVQILLFVKYFSDVFYLASLFWAAG